jgi:hypothetical protein
MNLTQTDSIIHTSALRMKKWASAHGYSYAYIGRETGQTASNVYLKMNGKGEWQASDLRYFASKHGLSSDFVLGTDSLLSKHRRRYQEG